MSDSQEKVVHSDAEWRSMLTHEQYHVLREKGTERPFTGTLTENHETGNYHCAGCGALLFLSGASWTPDAAGPASSSPPTQPDPVKARRALENQQATRRLGTTDDIAAGVLYLASDAARFMTGSELVIDGGYLAR